MDGQVSRNVHVKPHVKTTIYTHPCKELLYTQAVRTSCVLQRLFNDVLIFILRTLVVLGSPSGFSLQNSASYFTFQDVLQPSQVVMGREDSVLEQGKQLAKNLSVDLFCL